MTKKPLTQDEESYLRHLQSQASRLNTDWAYTELSKFCRSLEKMNK